MDEKYKDGSVYITDYALPITHYRTDTMSEIVNQSLQKIAKSTGIIFTGAIIGMLLAFVGSVIIVRYTDKFKYSENQFYSEGIK